MLPLIIIGATASIRTKIEADSAPVEVHYHATAELAFRDLLERRVSADDTGRFAVHVAYGPLAFGPLAMGRVGSVTSARLEHTGHTIILCWDVDQDPGRPRPVVDGQVDDRAHPDDAIWQAMTAVHADTILDVHVSEAPLTHLVRYLDRFPATT
ncbi:MAG TPA: hypothetical protein VGH72_33885 [Pseudonocardia sp.]